MVPPPLPYLLRGARNVLITCHQLTIFNSVPGGPSVRIPDVKMRRSMIVYMDFKPQLTDDAA